MFPPWQLPWERALRAERTDLVATVAGLERDDFEAGPTLCGEWSPRDVLAHVVGFDTAPGVYLRHARDFPGIIDSANAEIVAVGRRWSREELLARARRWAARPAWGSRLVAGLLLGDLVVHHQDVLRPRGVHRVLSAPLARAALREGLFMAGPARLTRVRLVPTDGLAPPLGFGRPVRGSTEALGMWLAGRESARADLQEG